MIFLERLADPAPLVYDGAFGSELFARGVELTNSTLANESHPDMVVDVHHAYIESGADVIGTNTFVASPLHLDMAGKDASEAEDLVRLSVQHAKAAVERSDKEIFIAGSIGPSPGAIEADSGDTDFGIANHLVRDAHTRVIDAMVEKEGVDLLILETMFSAKEAAIAVDVARQTDLPLAVNLTYKFTQDRKSGALIYKTDWGHSAASMLDILASGEFSNGDNLLDHVHILGLNCGAETRRSDHTGMPYAIHGIEQLRCAIEEKAIAPKRLMAYPNAGMPLLDENHRTYYAQTPADMAQFVPRLLNTGAGFIGGCCGTNAHHIKAFRQAVDALN